MTTVYLKMNGVDIECVAKYEFERGEAPSSDCPGCPGYFIVTMLTSTSTGIDLTDALDHEPTHDDIVNQILKLHAPTPY